MMLRREAIAAILDCLANDELVVLANGFISREGYNHRDTPRHFYMIGSMGLAATIGLGVALSRPEKPVVVLDGDGNLLMGLGVLPMAGAWQPARFLHVVLDNGTYGSTGSQPTIATAADFPKLALGSGYRRAASVDALLPLQEHVREWLNQSGPALLHVQVSAAEPGSGPRVAHDPPVIASRFASAIQEPAP